MEPRYLPDREIPAGDDRILYLLFDAYGDDTMTLSWDADGDTYELQPGYVVGTE